MHNQAIAINTMSTSTNDAVSSRVNLERMQHEIVTSAEDLVAMERDWTGLYAACANPQPAFQSFAWCLEWCRQFLGSGGGDDRLSIVCGYADGRLATVWPLVVERKLGLRTLKWLGEPVSQYGDVLVRNDPRRDVWIEEGLDFIRSSIGCDLVNLAKVREDSPLAKIFAREGCERMANEQAPFVDLQQFDSIDSFRKAQSKKTRRTRRRMRVLLEEQGVLKFEIHHGGKAAVAAIENAFAFKAAWLEQRGIISRAFSNNRVLEFWTGLAQRDNKKSGLIVAVLSCGDQPIAIEIGLRVGDVHVAHVGSFHPEFEKFSPGSLQMEELIGACLEQGITTYDLLAPHDTYKERWASGRIGVSDYVLPVTAAGRAWSKLSRLQLQKLAKEQFARLPKFARQSIAQVAGVRAMSGAR